MESDLFFETDILISNIYFPVKAYVHHNSRSLDQFVPTMESDLFFETDILISNIYFPVKAYVHHNSRSLDQFVPTIFWGPWFYLFNIWHMHVFICQAASNMVIHLQLSAFYWIGSRSW